MFSGIKIIILKLIKYGVGQCVISLFCLCILCPIIFSKQSTAKSAYSSQIITHKIYQNYFVRNDFYPKEKGDFVVFDDLESLEKVLGYASTGVLTIGAKEHRKQPVFLTQEDFKNDLVVAIICPFKQNEFPISSLRVNKILLNGYHLQIFYDKIVDKETHGWSGNALLVLKIFEAKGYDVELIPF